MQVLNRQGWREAKQAARRKSIQANRGCHITFATCTEAWYDPTKCSRAALEPLQQRHMDLASAIETGCPVLVNASFNVRGEPMGTDID